jgi:predicted NBD/HSP70 family sugar kinase
MITDSADLTENKRRVITLLKKYGPLSKGHLAVQGGMGWATAVKVISQLTDAGIVERLGTVREDNGKKGKRAYLYGLTPANPLAVGIDVEYRTTSMVLTNLKGETLDRHIIPTVNPTSDRDIQRFLFKIVRDFLKKNLAMTEAVRGVGIGIPGIGFPSHRRLDNIIKMRDLEIRLSNRLEIPVRVSDNTKAYTVFEQWSNQTFPLEDFIFISIRTGVGSGIYNQGNLYLGNHGLSGEIGHIPVVPDGALCRCGNRGCMETIVGQRNLFREYSRRVLGNSDTPEEPESEAIQEGLADLFTQARRGEIIPMEIIGTAAGQLGRCLAMAIMVLDITNIVVSGHFGPDGDVLIGPLESSIRSNLLPGSVFSVKYLPFDPDGHVQGAALLVLKDYFIDMRKFQL